VNFSGTVFGLSGRCPDVTFIVLGPTFIVVDASTDFHKSKCGDLRNGRSASGQGVIQPNGTVKATQIETDNKDD
jgi:hypothetical protein